MKTTIILILSGILIGAGISIIWRDLQRKRRSTFVAPRGTAAAEGDPDIEITISSVRPEPVRQASWTPAAEVSALRQRDDPPSLERDWAALQPALVAGIEDVNAALAPSRLFVSAAGEPSWSYRNKGYGTYRRLLLAGESLGWLRLELSSEGLLRASVKAHKDDRAAINAAIDAPAAGLTAPLVYELLSQCLLPAKTYAVRQGGDGEQEASEKAWESVDASIASALKATNGALAQAGARLVALGPAAWEQGLRHHRMTLSVEVNGDHVARMHIERLPHELEVAVGVREPHLVDLGRRRRIPVEGMTIHGLAELIASCAWPAIARFRESRSEA